MNIKQIYLDLDDVLNQFTPTALRHVGCNINHYQEYPACVGYDIVAAANKLLGRDQFTEESFWRCIPRSLWANCPVSEDAYWLLDKAVGQVGKRNVFILTAPTADPECFAGKIEWIYKHLPPWIHRQVVIAKAKYTCGKPGALLIDDNEKNCTAFHQAGGQAWLAPRPWNILRCMSLRDAIGFRFSKPAARWPSFDFLRAIGLVPRLAL